MADSDNKNTRKKSKKTIFLLIIGSLGCIVALKTTYIFVVLMLLPSIVAYFVDTTPYKSIFHTVLPCNLSGFLPYLTDIMMRGNKSVIMMNALGDIYVWFVIYLSAGFGWFLIWSCPKICYALVHSFNSGQVEKLKSFQQRLEEEWGPEIRRSEEKQQ